MAIAASVWYTAYVVGLACLTVPLGQCAKLPSWSGPDIFIDGILPSARRMHGFVSCNGTIYVFGGDDATGELMCTLL